MSRALQVLVAERLGLPICASVLMALGCAPELSECERGGFYADCGGDGDPRYACRDDDDCLWFSGGQVASGFQASSCPASDVCCNDGDPFRDGSGSRQLRFWGQQPWDSSRAMVLPVSYSETLAVTEFSCSAQQTGDVPCPSRLFHDRATATVRDITTITIPAYYDFYGWTPIVEIDQVNNVARVCKGHYSDTPVGSCPSFDRLTCADRGSVQVSFEAPDDAHFGVLVAVEATFGDVTIAGTLRIESLHASVQRPFD